MWTRLKSLHTTKSLTYRQFLTQQPYSIRMVENKPIIEKLTEFNKDTFDLEIIEVRIEVMTKLWFCYVLYQDLLSLSILRIFILYGKEDTTT